MLNKTPGLGTRVQKPSDFFLALNRRVVIVSHASSSACGFSSYVLALSQGLGKRSHPEWPGPEQLT